MEMKFERRVNVEGAHVIGEVHNEVFYLTSIWTETGDHWGSDYKLTLTNDELDIIINELKSVQKQMNYDFGKLEVE